MLALIGLLLLQPDTAGLKHLFEQEFQRHPSAQSARDLGLFLSKHGDLSGARSALREAVRMEPGSFADALELAFVSPSAEAGPLLEKAAASPDNALAARALDALGHWREGTGDRSGAIDAYRNALAKKESANTLEALANDVDDAEGIPLLRRVLAMRRTELGPGHPQTATTEANLAGKLLNTGQTGSAILLLRDAIRVFEQRLGPEHPRVATVSTMLAFGFRAKGDRVQAERYFRRSLAIDQAALGVNHEQSIRDAQNLADFLKSP